MFVSGKEKKHLIVYLKQNKPAEGWKVSDEGKEFT